MEKPKDYYSILGVPRDASPAAIRSAYRRLTRGLRPETESGQTFHDVQQAYEVLSDAEQRRHYDQSLREPDRRRLGTPVWTHPDPTPGTPLRRPVRALTLSREIVLSPAEARAGGPIALDVVVPAPCPVCRRTGGRGLACWRCGGRGRVERRQPLALRIPPGVRTGTVFHVRLDEPDVHSVLLIVHVAWPR